MCLTAEFPQFRKVVNLGSSVALTCINHAGLQGEPFLIFVVSCENIGPSPLHGGTGPFLSCRFCLLHVLYGFSLPLRARPDSGPSSELYLLYLHLQLWSLLYVQMPLLFFCFTQPTEKSGSRLRFKYLNKL